MTQLASNVVAQEQGPVAIIEPNRGWAPVNLAELWSYRQLLWQLAVRDVQARYKQSLLGVSWAIIQPLGQMIPYAFMFSLLGVQASAQGVPYAVSTLCAMVPWTLFASALVRGGNSLIHNQHLITKVYFPRLITPMAPILASLVDFAMTLAALALVIVFYWLMGQMDPVISWRLLTLPLLVVLAVATALAVSLWLAALNAIYRDVQYVIPMLSQVWMLVSSVVVTTDILMKNQPDWVRMVYALNPMVGVVEGFRWAILGVGEAPGTVMLPSIGVVTVLLIGGMYYFRRLERTFADLV